jgi:hypothetical protein
VDPGSLIDQAAILFLLPRSILAIETSAEWITALETASVTSTDGPVTPLPPAKTTEDFIPEKLKEEIRMILRGVFTEMWIVGHRWTAPIPVMIETDAFQIEILKDRISVMRSDLDHEMLLRAGIMTVDTLRADRLVEMNVLEDFTMGITAGHIVRHRVRQRGHLK